MKRFIMLLFSTLIFIMILAGCAKNNKSKAEVSEQSTTYLKEKTVSNEGEASNEQNNGDNNGDILKDRKIIKNAEIDCSANNVVEQYQTILSWLKQNDGYEFNQNMTIRGEYKTIDAVFKINPENLDSLIDFISEKTEIINLEITTDDITEDYLDIQLRLKSKKAALDQYYNMMKETASLDEILVLQKIINEHISEIESMEGKLLFWDKQVGESTIKISFSETSDPLKPKKKVSFDAMSFGDMFTYIGNGFMSVVNIIFGVLQWVLIILISASPLIGIAVVVVFVMKRIKKMKN